MLLQKVLDDFILIRTVNEAFREYPMEVRVEFECDRLILPQALMVRVNDSFLTKDHLLLKDPTV